MNASIVSQSSRNDIPIAFAYGRRPLFSQDFVIVDNLLVNNPDFVNTLQGVLLTSAKPNMFLRAPKIELTAEFIRVSGVDSLIPMWYTQILRRTAKATSVSRRTLQVTADPGESVAVLGPLVDSPNTYVVDNTAELKVNGQSQATTAFYIDRGNNQVKVNIGNTNQANDVVFSYDLVQLSVEPNIENGYWSIIPSLHFGDKYIVRMLYSERTSGTIKYISEAKTEEDIVVTDPLFQEVPREIVAPRTFTFNYDEYVVFPNSEPYVLYGIRSLDSSSRTMVSVKEPTGLGQGSIWFIRLGGKVPEGYNIPEIPKLLYNDQPRRDDVIVVGYRKVRIGSKNISYTISEDGTRLDGINLYDPQYPDSPIPVVGYNRTTGMLEVATDVPVGKILTAEYREFIDWVEYEGIQLNPFFAEDKSILTDNYIVLYFVNREDLDSTLGHILLPKVVDGVSKIYSFAEIEQQVKLVDTDAIPIALVQVVEPVDQDYYILYDVRQLGGLNHHSDNMMDYSYWDGESVDLTGQFFTEVSKELLLKVKDEEKRWNPSLTDEQATLVARDRIERVINKYIRVGMNNEIIWEDM